jgi:hypothetical protein
MNLRRTLLLSTLALLCGAHAVQARPTARR